MRVSIMTCEDRTDYLCDTINQLHDQGIEYDIYYQGATTHPNGTIKVAKPYDDPWKNSQYNYAMILLNSKNAIILEDDVKICKDFEKRANGYISHLPTRYALAMYSCYHWKRDYPGQCRAYPLSDFYGTQAMMYDEETRIGFGQYLLHHIGKEPYDLALKTFLTDIDPKVPLLATSHSLAQHMGAKTTGLGYHHQAPNFIDD